MRILSIIVFLLTILSAFGGRFNPDFFTTPALLSLILPYLAITTLLLTVFWAVSRKIIFTALGVITLVICMDPLSQAMPLATGRLPEKGEETFKVISWNVLHTEDLRKPDYPGNRAVEFMINSGADVIGLAELRNFSATEFQKASKELLDSLDKAYPYRAGLNTTDLKVLSKYPVTRIDFPQRTGAGEQRFDFFKINFPEGKELILCMVHLFSYNLSDEERNVVTEIKSVKGAKESMKEFKGSILSKMRAAFQRRAINSAALREAINEINPETPLIVCGDFNDVPTSWSYNLIRGTDMRDAYSETNIGPAFTYNLHLFYFHIDQMLYRGDIKALNLKVGKINTSDHYPLIGEFAFDKSEKLTN